MVSPPSRSSESLRGWLRRQMRGGSVRPPRPSRSVKSFVRLEDVLRRSPRTFGFDADAWSIGLLRTYLTRELGLPISEAEVARRVRAVSCTVHEAASQPLPALLCGLAPRATPYAFA